MAAHYFFLYGLQPIPAFAWRSMLHIVYRNELLCWRLFSIIVTGGWHVVWCNSGDAVMHHPSSHAITSPVPSFRKRMWIGIGLMFILMLVNELAAGQDGWLWGAGLPVGALIGLVAAMRSRDRSHYPMIEALVWIVAAALGIIVISTLPKHVLYTLLKITIIALLWIGRRDHHVHNHGQHRK